MAHRARPVPQLMRSLSTSTRETPKARREKDTRDRFLRVDHAGEVGADRIYAGQMAVLGKEESNHLNRLRFIFTRPTLHLLVFAHR